MAESSCIGEVVNYAVTYGNIQFDTETGTIIGADGSVTEANIPDKIEGVEIISIADKAFSEWITSVKLSQ